MRYAQILHSGACDSPVGADKTNAKPETTDETTAQQEGAGQNPACFAADALQGGRAKRALLAVADGDTPCLGDRIVGGAQ